VLVLGEENKFRSPNKFSFGRKKVQKDQMFMIPALFLCVSFLTVSLFSFLRNQYPFALLSLSHLYSTIFSYLFSVMFIIFMKVSGIYSSNYKKIDTKRCVHANPSQEHAPLQLQVSSLFATHLSPLTQGCGILYLYKDKEKEKKKTEKKKKNKELPKKRKYPLP
jgi:hypothetical protein